MVCSRSPWHWGLSYSLLLLLQKRPPQRPAHLVAGVLLLPRRCHAWWLSWRRPLHHRRVSDSNSGSSGSCSSRRRRRSISLCSTTPQHGQQGRLVDLSALDYHESAAATATTSPSATLDALLRQTEDDGTPVQMTGTVTAVRGFGSSFCFVDLQLLQSTRQKPPQPQQPPLLHEQESSPTNHDGADNDNKGMTKNSSKDWIVQAMLKRQEYQGEEGRDDDSTCTSTAATTTTTTTTTTTFDGLRDCCVPGTTWELVGNAAPTRNRRQAVLLVRRARLAAPWPSNPQHFKIVLQAAARERLPVSDVVEASSSSVPGTDGTASSSPSSLSSSLTTARLRNLLDEEVRERVDGSHKAMASVKSSSSSSSLAPPFYNLAKRLLAEYPPKNHGSGAVVGQQQRQPQRFLPTISDALAHPPDWILSDVLHAKENGRKEKEEPPAPLTTLRRDLTESDTQSSSAASASAATHLLEQTITGLIENRRRFQDKICVLELSVHGELSEHDGSSSSDDSEADESSLFWNEENNNDLDDDLQDDRFMCVLHPALVLRSDSLAHLMAPGSTVSIQGYVVREASSRSSETQATTTVHRNEKTTTENNPPIESASATVFWITQIRLERASWRPKVIEYLIDLTRQGVVGTDEAAHALGILPTDMKRIANLASQTARQWEAAECSRTLQNQDSRVATIVPEMLRVLDGFATAREQYPVQAVEVVSSLEMQHPDDGNRKKSTLDALRDGSRWKRKKEPQLQWMAKQVELVLQSHPAYGKRQFRILDIGGAKGYLANHLAAHPSIAKHIQAIKVIDIDPRAVKNGAMRSRRLQLPVEYQVGDASAYVKEQLQDSNDGGVVDIVVALHACGTLTDVALGIAGAHGAGFVICPCCFRSHPHLRVTTTRNNNNKTGKQITVNEWLDVNSTEYETLKLLAEVQGDRDLASKAIHSICSLRAAAAKRHSMVPMGIAIKTFPIAFSTRNFCLVGSFLR